jgi:hypothetical protein
MISTSVQARFSKFERNKGFITKKEKGTSICTGWYLKKTKLNCHFFSPQQIDELFPLKFLFLIWKLFLGGTTYFFIKNQKMGTPLFSQSEKCFFGDFH